MMEKYRADHIGSFLRPQELLDARHGHNDVQLREVEDRNIRDVLSRQAELGFDICTDGEFRRSNFMSDFTDSVEGFALDEDAIGHSWKADSTDAAAKTAPSHIPGIVAQKLRQTRRLTALETPFLLANSPADVKVTLPSPNQFPFISFKKGVTDKVYANHSELLADVVAILKGEVAALVADGVQYIQIDTPRYSYYIDPKWREWLRSEIGVDPDTALDEAIAADNACFDACSEATRNSGVTLAMHLCRGNNRGNWYAQGGYDAIAEKLFSGLHVDRFLLEFDDERSGTFEPLRFVPAGKTVVLGLVSTKRAEMERPGDLLRRVDEASKYVPLENLALSPQCGFASVMEGNPVTEDTQWAKLKLVADTARQLWR
jgi:5-methyltetrahydropteroyltriglutamate--homocysteine methyltransferase